MKQGTGTDSKLAHTLEETSLELGKLQEEMLNTPLLTPQVMLEQVIDVFSKPEEFIRIRKLSLTLNKMGIKINGDSPQPANKLSLTEVVIGNNPPRVVALATFPRNELLSRKVFSAF